MPDTQIDQVSIYREYFEAVKTFNTANENYLKAVNDAASNRQLAIQRAVEVHIDPLLSRVHRFQKGSVVGAILSLIMLCGGWKLADQLTSNSQSSGSVVQGGLGVLLILASLTLGFLSIVVFSWTSTKISDLNSSVREAQATHPSILPEED